MGLLLNHCLVAWVWDLVRCASAPVLSLSAYLLHLLSFLGACTAFLRGSMLYFYPYFQGDFTSSWLALCGCFFCPFPPCSNGLRRSLSIVPGEGILTYRETMLAAGRWHLGVPPLLCEEELPEDWELTAVCGSSLLRCTGYKGKHAQKRKYSNSQSGECWKSCESMRSSGRVSHVHF